MSRKSAPAAGEFIQWLSRSAAGFPWTLPKVMGLPQVVGGWYSRKEYQVGEHAPDRLHQVRLSANAGGTTLDESRVTNYSSHWIGWGTAAWLDTGNHGVENKPAGVGLNIVGGEVEPLGSSQGVLEGVEIPHDPLHPLPLLGTYYG